MVTVKSIITTFIDFFFLNTKESTKIIMIQRRLTVEKTAPLSVPVQKAVSVRRIREDYFPTSRLTACRALEDDVNQCKAFVIASVATAQITSAVL